MKKVYRGYQNNVECTSLIPKRHPGIINFSITDPRIENSIPELQLITTLPVDVYGAAALRVLSVRSSVRPYEKKTRTAREIEEENNV